jgi:hypothetical protein
MLSTENLRHLWGGIAAGCLVAAILSALLFDESGVAAAIFLSLAALGSAIIALTRSSRSKFIQKEIAIQPFLNPENGQLYFAVFKFRYDRPRTLNDNREASSQKPDDFDTRLYAALTEKFLLQLSNTTELPSAYSIRQMADSVVVGIAKEEKIPVFRIYLTAIERPNRRMAAGPDSIIIGSP